MKFLIGTSGWTYKAWSKRFYPKKIAEKDKLTYYSSKFNTVEINNTFYRIPSEKAVKNWHKRTNDHFVFAIKASRYITHLKVLSDNQAVVFLMGRISLLKNKLGPVLFQLPPYLHKSEERLKKFTSVLPRGYKSAFEFRHNSWYDDNIYQILREKNIAFVIHDHKKAQTGFIKTADWSYLRMHGSKGDYSGSYTKKELEKTAEKLMSLDVNTAFIYFNNDANAYAVDNAKNLERILSKGTW